jgi:hypothetical protein
MRTPDQIRQERRAFGREHVGATREALLNSIDRLVETARARAREVAQETKRQEILGRQALVDEELAALEE